MTNDVTNDVTNQKRVFRLLTNKKTESSDQLEAMQYHLRPVHQGDSPLVDLKDAVPGAEAAQPGGTGLCHTGIIFYIISLLCGAQT